MADFDKLATLLESEATLASITKAYKSNHALRHACNKDGNTLLHLATAHGKSEVVRFLLEQHARIAAVNHEGQTALHLAALSTNAAQVTALLSEIASMPSKARTAVLDAKDAKLGRTALHYAAKLGCEGTVRQLIDAGADIDSLTNTQHTALRSAAAQGHSAAVTALIVGKAKVSMPDAKGVNALHAAASIGSMEAVSALLLGQDSQAALKAYDMRGCSVLHYAISSGRPATQLVPLLEALLQRGADSSAADAQGITPLHQAAQSSPCAVLEALLGAGAAINAQDQAEGKTALHFAAERGVQAAVKLLLDKGARAVVRDRQGRLPHELAAGKTRTILVKEAERQGQDVPKDRPDSAAVTSKRRSSAAGPSEGMPFVDITNIPGSRAPAAISPSHSLDKGTSDVKGVHSSLSRGDALRRRSEGLENLQQQLQGVMMEGTQIQEYVERASTGRSKETSAQQTQASSDNTDANASRGVQSRSGKMQQLREAYDKAQGLQAPAEPANADHRDGATDREAADAVLDALKAEASKVPGLNEQVSRLQAAVDQWKANDSVQLEGARRDIEQLKQELEARAESARVASAQCKAAQAELKAVRQQVGAQSSASQAEQAALDSLRQQLATQDASIASMQTELESAGQKLARECEESSSARAELDSAQDSLKAQLAVAQTQLASAEQQLSLEHESSQGQQKQLQLRVAELGAEKKEQAERLQKAEEEVQAMAYECRHLKALQQQLVSDCDRRLAAASEAEGAIRRATATQVESLQRQVASLASLQAENEDLKAASEAEQQKRNAAMQEANALKQALSEVQSQEQRLQQTVAELQALQQATEQQVEQLSKKDAQLTADKSAVESLLSLREAESKDLKEQVAEHKSWAVQHAEESAALQNESAEQARSIGAGNAQLKLMQYKVKQLEEQLVQSQHSVRSQNTAEQPAPGSATVQQSNTWQHNHISQMQQKWASRLQRIRECCLPSLDAVC